MLASEVHADLSFLFIKKAFVGRIRYARSVAVKMLVGWQQWLGRTGLPLTNRQKFLDPTKTVGFPKAREY
jgi:hypothetical protein